MGNNLNQPRHSSLVLSKGAVLDTTWDKVWDDFPVGATTSIEFLDSSGLVITEIAGEVTPKKLIYLITDTDQLDSVPGGAQYELWVTTADGPYKMEYGTVIRREATFFAPVQSAGESDARLFTDQLGRTAVGRRWIATRGGITMHPLGGDPPVYAMGPDVGLLFSQAGIRYFRPLGGDSWRFQFQIYNTGQIIGLGGTGKMRLHAGCDIHLTTGMSFEIETGVFNNRVHTGVVTTPTDIDYTGTPVNNTAANGDIWTVDYSDITKHMQVWKGANPVGAPLIEWIDTANELPHGPGFRYWGFSWDSSLLATGPVLSSVEAQDYV